MNTFFVLWFALSSNFSSLTLLKFDTEIQCIEAGKALVRSYNENKLWVSPDLGNDSFRCIKVNYE